MAKIIHHCPVCQTQADLTSEYRVDGLWFRSFSCGHTQSKQLSKEKNFDDIVSDDGKQMRPYQKEGAAFGLNSGGRCLIADEMGLGKTIQAIAISKKLNKRWVLICKKKLQVQMLREFNRWAGALAQIIYGETDFLIPGMNGFIISYDTLWRFKDIPAWVKKAKLNDGILILDECQHIKNSQAKRTQGVRILSREIEHCIALSGTPIKNHAGEFFPILNILRPDRYPNQTQFEHVECEIYSSIFGPAKIGGLKNAERFYEKNKDFIIRRLKKDVAPELPDTDRNFMFTELGPEVEKLYIEQLKQFQSFYNSGAANAMSGFQRQTEVLGYLNKMRHLTGIAKCIPVVEYVQDFLDSTEDEKKKIVIFLHHKNVAKILSEKFVELNIPCEYLSSQAGPEVIDHFREDPNCRVLLASTLAAGEGLNLQFCSDCIIMERQWNPANELQAEARFSRIGQLANKISATYFTAVGTVDEFLVELVEKKRAISSNVLDAKEIDWNEQSIIKELADILASTGGRKWGF